MALYRSLENFYFREFDEHFQYNTTPRLQQLVSLADDFERRGILAPDWISEEIQEWELVLRTPSSPFEPAEWEYDTVSPLVSRNMDGDIRVSP